MTVIMRGNTLLKNSYLSLLQLTRVPRYLLVISCILGLVQKANCSNKYQFPYETTKKPYPLKFTANFGTAAQNLVMDLFLICTLFECDVMC